MFLETRDWPRTLNGNEHVIRTMFFIYTSVRLYPNAARHLGSKK